MSSTSDGSRAGSGGAGGSGALPGPGGPARPPGRVRVIVVDDDPEALALICVRLKEHPRIEIIGTGQSGREAIQLANTLHPDVMVLDVMMPVLNGLEAAARIAKVFPSIGLLILTSEASPESIRLALRAGAKDYLDKSTELMRLAEAVVDADEKRDRNAADRGLASVWGFYSAKGSSGTTTLAAASAHELARLGHKVLLVDLDALHGDCAFYLNLPPQSKNLLASMEELRTVDLATVGPMIRRFTDPTAPAVSLDVVDSPCDFVASTDRSQENMVALLDLLATVYEYVVIDLPAGRIFDPHIVPVLDFVERLFFVTSRDMSSLRSLLVFSRILARSTVRIGRFTVLFSALRDQSSFDYAAWLANARLGTKNFMEVPLDQALCGRALSEGVPVSLANPDAPLGRFIRNLVAVSMGRGPLAPPVAGAEPEHVGTLWTAFKRMLGG
jgi:DNA-binding NarL/FixJ family response regulator